MTVPKPRRTKADIDNGFDKPVPLQVLPQNIPAELTKHQQWVGWQYIRRDGKWTKVPINAKTEANASSTDPTTWGTFQEALALYSHGKADGVGYVVNGSGIVGIDLDKCRDPDTGEITGEAQEIVSDFAAYTEASASGTGLRIFCHGTMPEDGRKVGDKEFFQSKKYLTVTGHKLPGCQNSIDNRQPQLDAFYKRYFAKNDAKTDVSTSHGLFSNPATDAEIISKAGNAANGAKFSSLWAGDTGAYGGDDSNADLALCSFLAFFTGPDATRIDSLIRQSGLYRDKWERTDYRDRTIAKALEGKTEFYKWSAAQASTSGQNAVVHPPPAGLDKALEALRAPKPLLPFPDPVLCSRLQGLDEKDIWVWNGIVAKNAITLLSSHPKCGKTTLLSHFFRCTANGDMFLDREVLPCNVLVVSEESQDRWKKRRDDLGLQDNLFFYCRPFRAKPSHTDWNVYLRQVAEKAKANRCELIVLDTLGALWPVMDENSATEVQMAMTPIHYLTDVGAVLASHHLKKAGGDEGTGARGSSSLAGFVDVLLELKRLDPSDRQCCKRVMGGYGRFDSVPQEVVIEFNKADQAYVALGDRQEATKIDTTDTLKIILPRERPGMTFEDIKAAWPNDTFPRKQVVLNTLNEGESNGTFIKDGFGNRKGKYSYWIQE